MLIVFTRSILIYIFLLITMRLMGKKQLGELQPFEFAITLVVAELACIPLSDISVPMLYGLVPIFTLFVVEFTITKVVKHNLKLRKIINGNPVIIINTNGIDYKAISKLDMTIHDVLVMLRDKDYLSPEEVEYAIIETNGKMSVIPKSQNRPTTLKDFGMVDQPPLIPYCIMCEGKILHQNMKELKFYDETLQSLLNLYNLKQKDILLLSITSKKDFYLQPINKHYISGNIDEVLK